MNPVHISGLAPQCSYCHGSTLRPQVSGLLNSMLNSTLKLHLIAHLEVNFSPFYSSTAVF